MAAREATAEERKVVTVLFADLEASTELASRLDPEDLRAVLRPFFAAMMEEIERHGGTVEKFIGDAVVGVFGAPVAHEDDPVRAVEAALAMQARLPALNEQIAARAGGDLAMRIGVNTGDVLAAHRGEHEGYVVGEPVNVASRLQSLAAPGSVVVGERTWRYTRRTIGYRRLADVTVKGVRHPLPAWEVVPDGVAAATESHDAIRFRSPLVGREEELGMLRLLLGRTTSERRPNLVTIVGPPGMGKSRLAWAFADEARQQSLRVVGGRCPPYGDGLAYWPLAEVLKADAGILESDPPDVVLTKADALLAPRFAGGDDGVGTTQVLLSSIGVASAADPLAGSEPAAAKRLIAGAWRRYFESSCESQPLLLLIEDLHWADEDLLELVESFATRVSGQLLTICTARPELWERRAAWSAGLPNATTIALAPLSASEATHLVGELLGGTIPADVAARIVDRAEGNPFFASELLLMMVEEGTLERRGETWELTRELPSSLPDTVQGVIASRIDLLQAGQKRAIQDAAVVGRTFWPGAVARLGSRDADSELDALVAAGLVWEREASTFAGERELMFNHILTRDVAYASLPRARRLEAHATVISWIEETTRGRDEELAEILSYHAKEAADSERTARYAMLAGHRHRRVFAAEEAIRWYDEALAAIDALPSGDGTLLLAESTLSRGEACEQLGRFPEARADYERALAVARAPGRPRPWLEARALAALAHVHWQEDRYDAAEALLPQALAAAEAAGADDLTVRLLYTAGSVASGKRAWADALSFHERALQVAERAGDRESEALARQGIAETRVVTGPFEDGLREARLADRLLRELGRRPLVHRNEHALAWQLWLTGSPDEAARVASSSLAGARELGDRRAEAAALAALGLASLSRGQLATAARSAAEAVEVAAETGASRLEPRARSCLALILGELQAPPSQQLNDGDLDGPMLGAEAPLELVLAARLELLAWEHVGDAAGLEAAAARLRSVVAGDAWPGAAWASFGTALAASHRDDHRAAVDGARESLALATSMSEVPIVWRSYVLLARASDALGLTDEAASHRAHAAGVLSPMAEALDPDHRAAFRARTDVALALG